jgi:UDP-N-acetylglucosamine 2-epimerase (non-hydrolysing)
MRRQQGVSKAISALILCRFAVDAMPSYARTQRVVRPRSMKILSVVGARPNLVKIAPILRALERPVVPSDGRGTPMESVLVHTGQHYDETLSAGFFDDLRIRAPDHALAVGSGTHAVMTAEIMRRFEPVLLEEQPDVVLVVGDVNSTLACALTAAKLQLRVAHVEAGLRSFDRAMPEEINRVLTDALSDFLFTTEEDANANLLREGHPAEQVFFVGNVAIDSLMWARPLAERSTVLDRLDLDPARGFAVLTVHRPSNLESALRLGSILSAAAELARDVPVVLPAHPRTRSRIAELGLASYVHPEGRICLTDPLGYLDCVHMLANARLVLTDSGGIQEETTWLGVPCLTLRDNTERPATITAGTNTLVGTTPERIIGCARAALRNGRPHRGRPPLWDGHAAERIVRTLADRL